MTSTGQQDGSATCPGTVLIVDDNPLITGVLKSLLAAEHFDVAVATNGEEALQVLGEHPTDVIICDVMMPRMDGYAFHSSVRQQATYAHIPFIFLTALSDDSEVHRGLMTGADVYLTKPFDPRSIVPLVKGKILRSRELKKNSTEQFENYRKKVVNTLSHEFRTPLVAITTGSELLADHGENLDASRTKGLIDAIRRGGQRLERLVSDFMLLQQLDSGQGKKLYQARGSLESLDSLIRPIVEQKAIDQAPNGFSIKFISCKDSSQTFCYVPHIEDAALRLLDNAIKFSKGTKEIEVEVISGDGKITIEVRDRGVGLDPRKVSEALELFGHINREKLEQQGTGMGLALVKRYAEVHGGKLLFQSREGGGAIVALELPQRNSAPTP